MKKCIACGMPMENAEDFAAGDSCKEYCRYCAKEDGSMKSYLEKKRDLTVFVQKTQGIAEAAAAEVAVSMMKELPAWRDYQ
ncbi:AraC family transcriptional regulator [Enterococcus florum]|uniref:AraC family transcriptional regulator n=1 Tax=Enterococcus florum TaxID=2480627 RepID=A0A4P5PHL1_9ENTE|nr:zinc ribbon domain-containing protein [Enterococcus florum]GCF95911.1 AraC family transcriptional regulator [Enterococcus florum]